MHNLFKIRGQKNKKDDVKGQITALTLKHVINMKTLFFKAIHMSYINYYALFIYKWSNKQIKLAICTSRLFQHTGVITFFFSWTLSPSNTDLHGLDFSGPGPVRTKDKSFGPALKKWQFQSESITKYKILARALPDQFFFSDFGTNRLGLSDFKTNLFNY